MRWSFSTLKPADVKADALVVGVFDDLSFDPLAGARKNLQAQARQVKFKGSAGETFFAFEPFGKPKKHLLLVGLGKRSEAGADAFRSAAAAAVRALSGRSPASAAVLLPFGAAGSAHDAARGTLEGIFLGASRFTAYVTDPEAKPAPLATVHLLVAKKSKELEAGASLGHAVAEGVLLARELVSEPANVLTPKRMVEEARRVAKAPGMKLTVLSAAQCEKLGMGAYLAVAKGSRNEAQFIHLSYRPKGASFKLGLVGKGLTFDSGGLSLKPADGMGAMKSDMGGSAAVLGTMKVIGQLQPKVAVEAVMAMCENMPDGGAYRPGDILTSLSGKTIEVQNTDAEGRLTLADALTYVQREKVDAVIDLATLTGACVVALGPDFSGLMTNNQPLGDAVLAAAKHSGDEIWQLPLPAAYGKYIKSPVADVANISRIRWGGAITAGLFLKTFIENDTPWVHLDIAGPALRDDDGPDANKAEGSGVGVRTLVNFVLAKEKGA